MRTDRGRSLEEVLPQIKAELGPDALVVAQREAHEGGVGGFFAKRMIEVDVQTSGESHDQRVARFTEQLEAALSTGNHPPAPAQKPAVSEQVDEFPMADEDFEPPPLVAGAAAYAPATPETVPPVAPATTDASLPADAHAAIDRLTASGLSHDLAADLVDQAVNHLCRSRSWPPRTRAARRCRSLASHCAPTTAAPSSRATCAGSSPTRFT
jgi:hypothetical protein